jgi:hypothetical protein
MTLRAASGSQSGSTPAPGESVEARPRALPGAPEGDHRSWHEAGVAQVARVVRVIRDADEATVEDAVLRLSRTHRLLAPLVVAVGSTRPA